MTASLTLHHIPVCPFSQRLEILLALKGQHDAVRCTVVDITRPRDPAWLAHTRGVTALPVLELPDGRLLRESLVLMAYLDDALPGPRVARSAPYERAVEALLTRLEGPFGQQGYALLMNQDASRRAALHDGLLAQYAQIDAFLCEHAPKGEFLFADFGWAEAVFTPLFMRFWALDYYEGFALPDAPAYARVRRWRDACLAHPAAQQVTREEVVKLYFDYARGVGNGALPAGRQRSSFVFEPHWRERPWPPQDKAAPMPSDAALGLH